MTGSHGPRGSRVRDARRRPGAGWRKRRASKTAFPWGPWERVPAPRCRATSRMIHVGQAFLTRDRTAAVVHRPRLKSARRPQYLDVRFLNEARKEACFEELHADFLIQTHQCASSQVNSEGEKSSLRRRRRPGRSRTGPSSRSSTALGELVEGASVLDAFAGTGSLGLECLSRGAQGRLRRARSRGLAVLAKKH